MRVPLSFLGCLALSGCLRPTQERAERDREIGSASEAGATVSVDGGLAAVREMTEGTIVLWASAPVIAGRLLSESSMTWALEVQNALPDLELTVRSDHGDVVPVTALEQPLSTRKKWELALAGGTEVTFSLAPPDAGGGDPFTFAVLSDVQEALPDVGDFYVIMNDDPSLRFVLGAGDLTERGTEEELREFQMRLEKLDIPYYATLGNHELGDSPPLYHDYFGRGSHHFTFHGVHFSMVDSASASIDPIVYGWLDHWLDDAHDAVHIVAMHIPPVDPFGLRNGSFGSRNEAAKLLSTLARGRVDLTLYGHVHSYYKFENAGIPAYISGGGGAIPERFDGVGRHFLVVRVDPGVGVLGTRMVQID